jgi:hypothetical protein
LSSHCVCLALRRLFAQGPQSLTRLGNPAKRFGNESGIIPGFVHACVKVMPNIFFRFKEFGTVPTSEIFSHKFSP